jgi:ornithine carbamoyltransferase
MYLKDNFKGRDFLTLMDFNPEEIDYILRVSKKLKEERRMNISHTTLVGRTVALIFDKASTRTRFSFQAGIAQLGMQSFFATPNTLQISRGEPIKDTARIIDKYCDALVLRTFGQEIIEEYACYMTNPVINALTDLTHPCQGLADMLTIIEKKGKIEGKKLCYVGDPWNVCHTLMIFSTLMGINCYIAIPKGWEPNKKIMDFCNENIKKDAVIVVTNDLEEALKDSDIVYANTFHSMGHKDIEERKKAFAQFQINEQTITHAKSDAIFMHCLPGYRGEEMTDGIIEGPQSVVFQQGENRLHTEKAIMSLIIA